MKYKGRVISCYFRYRFHSLVDLFVYDGFASDDESGMGEESRHHNTCEEAIEHALRKLKERLHIEGVVSNDNE